MNEEHLLEKTLEIAESSGYQVAYQHLYSNMSQLEQGDHPLVYYFLICLSAGCSKISTALDWMKQAIEEKGYWYRPEVFVDDDLEVLYNQAEFQRLKAISERKYQKASRDSNSLCTWNRIVKEHLLLGIHGNSQSAEVSLKEWRQRTGEQIQVEAVQSSTVDSIGSYRWNYEGENYLEVVRAMEKIPWNTYQNTYLGGFSAGCDMILRVITLTEGSCTGLFLQSPWIPFLKENTADILAAITKKGIRVHIYCGTEDEDCLEMAKELYALLQNSGLVHLELQEGSRHQFPQYTAQYIF